MLTVTALEGHTVHRVVSELQLLCARSNEIKNDIYTYYAAKHPVYDNLWKWRPNPTPIFHIYVLIYICILLYETANTEPYTRNTVSVIL